MATEGIPSLILTPTMPDFLSGPELPAWVVFIKVL